MKSSCLVCWPAWRTTVGSAPPLGACIAEASWRPQWRRLPPHPRDTSCAPWFFNDQRQGCGCADALVRRAGQTALLVDLKHVLSSRQAHRSSLAAQVLRGFTQPGQDRG